MFIFKYISFSFFFFLNATTILDSVSSERRCHIPLGDRMRSQVKVTVLMHGPILRDGKDGGGGSGCETF